MKAQRGFTLLEVLVATVIMAVAVTGALSAISASVRNASRLTDRDRAAMFARRKMEELQVEKRLPKRVTLEGQYDPVMTNGLPAGWKARVTPFEIPPNSGPGSKILERVEVQIWWNSGGNPQLLTIEGFRRSVLTPEDIAAGALLQR